MTTNRPQLALLASSLFGQSIRIKCRVRACGDRRVQSRLIDAYCVGNGHLSTASSGRSIASYNAGH